MRTKQPLQQQQRDQYANNGEVSSMDGCSSFVSTQHGRWKRVEQRDNDSCIESIEYSTIISGEHGRKRRVERDIEMTDLKRAK